MSKLVERMIRLIKKYMRFHINSIENARQKQANTHQNYLNVVREVQRLGFKCQVNFPNVCLC